MHFALMVHVGKHVILFGGVSMTIRHGQFTAAQFTTLTINHYTIICHNSPQNRLRSLVLLYTVIVTKINWHKPLSVLH